MFQNRRRVFLFFCLIVLLQALYYIVTLQTKPNEPGAAVAINIEPTNRSLSDTNPTPNTTATTATTTTTSVQSIEVNTTTSTTSTTTTTTEPPFANASVDLIFNATWKNSSEWQNVSTCQFSTSSNDTSIYKVSVSQTIHPYAVIEAKHGADLQPGGHFVPSTCRSEQRLAVIICYRNREQHLKMFLDNIHAFLKKQLLDYTIFVVNQHGQDQFNRAALFNVGFLEAMKLYSYDCLIFHDVDLLPEDLRNVYRCGSQPRHMSVAVDKFNYKLLYSTLFGGVTAFHLEDFLGAHGYPTVYWGWGGEDDDMYLRVVKKLKKSITRYPIEIARYKMIRTHDHTSGKANPHRHTILYSKYDYSLDGINTTNYTLHHVRFYRLFTLINVTLTEEPFEKIRQRLKIKKK